MKFLDADNFNCINNFRCFIINLFDKKQPKLYTFAFTDYPLMKPIRIATKGKEVSLQ